MVNNRYPAFNVVALAWHPTSNTLSFTTSQGQLYRWKDCIPSTHPVSFGSLKRAPLNNHTRTTSSDTSLSRSPSILSRTHHDQDDMFDEDDDFIVDDDGAGYVPAHNRKRNGDWGEEPFSKRGRSEFSSFRVKPHPPFQSGSTPWRGNRRYLSSSPSSSPGEMVLIIACNMIGHVWTVDQDTHNTVTCEFYDREAHHQFFFTDPYLYDKACLSNFPFPIYDLR
jgi:chromosome transmission fidelity protein 4